MRLSQQPDFQVLLVVFQDAHTTVHFSSDFRHYLYFSWSNSTDTLDIITMGQHPFSPIRGIRSYHRRPFSSGFRRLAVDNCFADLPVTTNYPQLSPTNEPTITLLRILRIFFTRSAQLTLATVAVPAYVYGYTGYQALASLHVPFITAYTCAPMTSSSLYIHVTLLIALYNHCIIVSTSYMYIIVHNVHNFMCYLVNI